MVALVRVILFARVSWEATNEATVVENVRAASMIVRKSLVEMVIYCCGGAEVLDPAMSE